MADVPPVGPVGEAYEPHGYPQGGEGWYKAISQQHELLAKSLEGEPPPNLYDLCRDQNAHVGNEYMKDREALPDHVGEAATLIININEAAINKQGITELPYRSKDPAKHLGSLKWELQGIDNPPPPELYENLERAVTQFEPKQIAAASRELFAHLLENK